MHQLNSFSRFVFLVLAVALAPLVVGCGGNATESTSSHVSNPKDGSLQNEAAIPFSFVLEQTWGEEDGADEQLLPAISSLSVDRDGNIYLYDRRAEQLLSYDSQGAHRWTVGTKGEGPGELNNVYGVVYDAAGYLYLFNQQGTRIDRFTLDGAYVDNQLAEPLGYSMLFGIDMLNATTLLASAPAWGIIGTKVVVIDIANQWKTVTEFTIDQTGDMKLRDGVSSGPNVEVFNGQIVNSNVTEYVIETRDTTGTVLSSFSRDIDKLIRPGFYASGNTSSISTYSSLGTPLYLNDDLFLVAANWPKSALDPDQILKEQMENSTPRPKYDVEYVFDFYNADRKLLYSLTTLNKEGLPFSGLIGSDTHGKLYAMMNTPFPQIGRFRVELTNP